MKADSSSGDRVQVPFNSLLPFLIITFGLAWGIIALFIFLPDLMTALFGELTGQHPLFFVAAAVAVVWLNREAMFSRQWSVTEVIPVAEKVQ